MAEGRWPEAQRRHWLDCYAELHGVSDEEYGRFRCDCCRYLGEALALLKTVATEAARERDLLWCRVLLDSIGPKGAESVIAAFNAMRPDPALPPAAPKRYDPPLDLRALGDAELYLDRSDPAAPASPVAGKDQATRRMGPLEAVVQRIADWPDENMENALTLHYDWRAWCREALAAYRAARRGEGGA